MRMNHPTSPARSFRALVIALSICAAYAALVPYGPSRLISDGDRLRVAQAKLDLGQIVGAIQRFQIDRKRLPVSLDEIAVAYDFLIPDDPWGNAYVYERVDAGDFDVVCLGADGAAGGEGFAADMNRESIRESAPSPARR